MLERGSKEYNAIQDALWQTLMLENARLLYNGIIDLRDQLLAEYGASFKAELDALCRREDAERFVSIKTKVWELLECAYDKDGTLLQQSPNFGLLSFWKKYFDTSPRGDEDAKSAIANMMIYHNILHAILAIDRADSAKKEESEDLPYLYENLCNRIQIIMRCRNSFIVHHVSCGDTHIVARSAYLAEEVEKAAELKTNDIAECLMDFRSKSPDLNDGFCRESVFQIPTHGKFGYWLLSLYEADDEQFYLLLQFEDEPSDTKELVKILFARDHLKAAVFRDYEHLLNLRYELGFVRFFRERTADKPPYPIILHTSDLHADKVFPTDESRKRVLDSLKPKDGIDLLVLSGDIVDGKNSNASQTQENYDYAAETIRKLVSKIWSLNGRISFDWKRRILFVPGNHDFAAMNLVKAVLKQRSLAAGLPYDGNNKVVAKFAYYLNFVLELLDVPIDRLIRDEINEVREYRRMNAKILLLNSSYDATSARTNKVRINEKIVERLTKSEEWKECSHSERALRVCILHHPPFDPIDYTLDGYDVIPGWKWGADADKMPMNALYSAMKAAAIGAEYDDANRRFDGSDIMSFKNQYAKLQKEVEDNNAKGNQENKYYFTKDAMLLYKYFSGTGDEESAGKLISEIQFNNQMAIHDQKEFDDCITNHLSDVDLFLCGHNHAKNDTKDIALPSTGLEKRVSVVGKLLVKDEDWKDKASVDLRIIHTEADKDEIKISFDDTEVGPHC